MKNPEPDETPARPFRFNAKVAQVAALAMVALALPLTLAILGFRDMRHSAPAPEIPVLRGSLEGVVDAQWSPPDLSAGTRKFERAVADGDACLALGESVGTLAEGLGGTVLSPERIEEGGTRWVVQIPAGKAAEFDAGLGRLGFAGPGEPAAAGEPVLYEVEIPLRP